jgi:hypothetical protein
MKIFDFYIERNEFNFFKNYLSAFNDIVRLNDDVEAKYHIYNFIENNDDFELLKNEFGKEPVLTLFENKIEYGDFQTPQSLANTVCKYLKNNNINPEIIIEPTAGFGNFLISSLEYFDNIKYVFCIEINKFYTIITKLRLIFYLEFHNPKIFPVIKIYNDSIFDFDFNKFNIENDKNILVIGNPPWVTNTKLGNLNSSNLPVKTNFKSLRGLDAMTGKSNFDISEYITLMLIEYFQNKDAVLCFLVKNTVVKNIIYDQKNNKYKLSNLKKIVFDANKEFNVSVDACMFYADFNKSVEYEIEEINLYDDSHVADFGWHGNNFVSNGKNYKLYKQFDGKSQLTWRSGIKHDLAKIMQLKKKNGIFINGLGEEFELEEDLVYSYLKGSFLKNKLINSSNLFTIITQTNLSYTNSENFEKFPLTLNYLREHEQYFNARKSAIYKNKAKFAIFGIGDYSFSPYKIGIASLYKKFSVTLIMPDENGKPIMPDDTCYFLGFNSFKDALITFGLLNSSIVNDFINSIAFNDSMRKFTKEVLMRINLVKIAESISFKEIADYVYTEFERYDYSFSELDLHDYIENISFNNIK